MSKQKFKHDQRIKNANRLRIMGYTLFFLGTIVLLMSLLNLTIIVIESYRYTSLPSNLPTPRDFVIDEVENINSRQRVYVTLQDGLWDCDSIMYISRSTRNMSANLFTAIFSSIFASVTADTEVFYTDRDQNSIIFVELAGRKSCSDLQSLNPTGYLTVMNSQTHQLLTDNLRLAQYDDAVRFMRLCSTCLPNTANSINSMTSFVLPVIYTLIGISMIFSGLRIRKYQTWALENLSRNISD